MFLFIVFIFALNINYTQQYKLDIDCINGLNNGITYKGTVNTTATGIRCLFWKYKHSNNVNYNYTHNYCRNPDNSKIPWCYADTTGYPRQECNITYCEDCRRSTTDLHYKGHISTTIHGYTCGYWNTTLYHGEEQNYCRTPPGDRDNGGGPWCYLYNHTLHWDRCNIPVCAGKSCPNLTNHLIPQDRKSIYHYEETVYLSCEAGYHMKGDKIISCKQSGQWNATLPICEEIICTRMSLHLTDGMHVIQDLHRYNIKEMVTMSCKSGFIGTTVRAQCIGLNKWSHIPPICTMITCTHISLHLTRSVNVTNGKQSYDFNEEVSMSCKSGFSGKTVTARCTDVNKWSKDSPTCTIASCPNLNLTPHLSQPRTLEGYHHKDEIHFGCDVGYYLVGSLVLSCLASGRWSSQQPTCKAASCPALPQIHHLHHIPDLSEYIYNDTVTFQCDVGFLLSGPASITCITNNRQSPVYWSGKQPSCTAIACPGLYEGYSITWSPNHTSYSYNDIVHFQCDAGYQLSGPSSLVCQADGNESIGYWSNKQPACVEEYKGVSYLVFGIVVALIIVVAVGVNIGLILLMRIKLKDSSKLYEDIKMNMGQLRNENEDQTYSELSDTQQ